MRAEEYRGAVIQGFTNQRMEYLLNQGIQAAGGFVEHQEFRLVHKGLQQSELLLVAFGELPGLAIEVKVQPLGEFDDVPLLNGSADGCEVLQHAPARGPVFQMQFAG